MPADLESEGWRESVSDSVRTADAVVVLLSPRMHCSQQYAVACARKLGKRVLSLSTEGNACTVSGAFRSPAWTIEVQLLIDSL